MSNKNPLFFILICLTVYFFKADLSYFAHHWTLTKNLKVEKLQHQISLLHQNIFQMPLKQGTVITQIDGDFMIIKKSDLPINTAALGNKGVIGKIVSQSKFTQTIALITNHNSKVSVFVPEVGRAILKGMGNKKLTLMYIDFFPHHKDFKKGDIIYTLGIEGIFPKKQPIAVIGDIKEDNKIICQPFENVDYLTQVSLLNLK